MKGTPPDRWSAADINVVRQLQYQADFQRFKYYRDTKITAAQKACINTVDHSAYLKEARVAPNTVIAQCVFSVAAYRAALEAKGGDVARFDQEVKSFKKGPKGSRAPDSEKVPMERVMLVCQRPDGTDVSYSDADGFGHPGTMGLWDLHSPTALARGKKQLPSRSWTPISVRYACSGR